MRDIGHLFSELKRRKVFRVAGVYAVVAWAAIEVAETVAPLMAMPEWAPKIVLFLALFGFPVALVLAWAFDLSPEGVKRTGSDPTSSANSRAPAYAGLGILVALVGFGAYTYLDAPEESSLPAERSIAVLPFENMSGDPENEYFSDGITEDILTNLSRIRDLRVTSRTSVMTYKGSDKTIPEIARELGVVYVLEGSVRREGGRVRITAQLIRAEDDAHLWADNHDRELTDIFWIQSEIAREIAGALKAELSPEERERIDARPTDDLDAYDSYLKGREYYLRLDDAEELKRGILRYREAIKLDPGFALAYAGMSDAFAALEGYHGLGSEWLDSAIVAGTRAILFDPTVAEAYAAQGHVHWLKANYELAIELNERALELNPSYAYAFWGLSVAHAMASRPVESLRAATEGHSLDPSSPWMTTTLGGAYARLDADEEAERWYRRALELDAEFEWARGSLVGLYLFAQGEYEKAEEQVRAARSLKPEAMPWFDRWSALFRGEIATAEGLFEEALDSPKKGGTRDALALAHIYRKLGKMQKVEEILRRAPQWEEAIRKDRFSASRKALRFAEIAVVQGKTDEAFRHLRAAAESGLLNPREDLQLNPLFENLRPDPRFGILLDQAQERFEAERVRAKKAGLL